MDATDSEMDKVKERIERLEVQVAELQLRLRQESGKDWLRAVEKYAGDEDLQAVFHAAMKLREADRSRIHAGRRPEKGG